MLPALGRPYQSQFLSDFSASQRARWADDLATGREMIALAITEPDAGSDMGALRCVGEQDEDGNWTVTGQKIFVTSGHGATTS